MSAPDPLKDANDTSRTISRKEFVIAGLKTLVYGLEELPGNLKNVACLWLLHPRLSDQSRMAPIANAAITHWNQRLESRSPHKGSTPRLIAVSFDQRNHGSRKIDPIANEAWNGGNPSHAQDMFSIYRACFSRGTGVADPD